MRKRVSTFGMDGMFLGGARGSLIGPSCLVEKELFTFYRNFMYMSRWNFGICNVGIVRWTKRAKRVDGRRNEQGMLLKALKERRWKSSKITRRTLGVVQETERPLIRTSVAFASFQISKSFVVSLVCA